MHRSRPHWLATAGPTLTSDRDVPRRCACSAVPKRLAERLEASDYDIPASEIEAGMGLHLPCLVKVGKRNNGYKTIEEFVPEAAE